MCICLITGLQANLVVANVWLTSFFNWQAVDHPYLVEYSDTYYASWNTDAGSVEQSCCLCHDEVESPVVSLCTSTPPPLASTIPKPKNKKKRE